MHPAAEFVVSMFGPHASGRVYIASLPNPENKGAEGEPDEHHILTRSSAQITDFVTRHDQPGEGCFTCVATIQDKATRRAEKTIDLIVCLHAEIDFRQVQEAPEEIERVIIGLPLPPSRGNYSGHGLHLYWFLKAGVAGAPESIREHKRLLRRLADHLGGDPAACLAHQMLRLPGTTNSKNGDSLLVRTFIDRPDRRYDYAELRTWIDTTGAPLLHRKTPAAAGNGESPDNPFLAFAAANAGQEPLDVERMLAEMVYLGPGGGGNAHDTLLRCTAAMLTRGESLEATVARGLAELQAAAARSGRALDLARERRNIEEMCRSWNEKHPESNQGDEEFNATSQQPRGWWHGDVDVELRRKYLVKKLIPETGTGLLPGQWGTYKTFVALDLAGAVMTGATFADHAVKRRGGVLFIAVEGRDEIPIRLEALNREKCGKAERLPFFCLDDIPRLLERGAADKIAADANAVAAEMQQRFDLPLALIIVDTVAAGAGYAKSGDENDSAIAQRIMDALARISKLTGAFVLAVDHLGKVVETGTRGSSAKESFADVVLALLGEKELSGGVKNPRMAARKRRGGPNGEEFAFTAQLVAMGTDEDGDPIDTLILEWGGEIEPTSADQDKDWPTKDTRLLRQVMMGLLAGHGAEIHPRTGDPPVRALDQEIVRSEFYKNKAADGDPRQQQAARQKAFRRAVDSARDRRLIEVRVIGEQTWLWLSTPHANA
jgi:AAA domain